MNTVFEVLFESVNDGESTVRTKLFSTKEKAIEYLKKDVEEFISEYPDSFLTEEEFVNYNGDAEDIFIYEVSDTFAEFYPCHDNYQDWNGTWSIEEKEIN